MIFYMKIALFGATGDTGLELIRQCVNYKYDLTAFVRNPDKLIYKYPELDVIKIDIDDYELLRNSVKDYDLIISLVGISGLIKAMNPNSLYERTAKNLIKLSTENNIKRLIVITSGGVVEAQNEPWFFKYLLKPIFLKKMYADMREMEKLILESNINYTIIRPPYLTKGKLTKNYRVILDNWFDDDKNLSRADLAHFILNNLENQTLFRRIVGLSY